MGSVCCCLRIEDFEDYVSPNGSVHRNCVCLRCFIRHFANVYSSIFRRGEIHSISSSLPGATPVASQSIPSSPSDSSIADTFRPPPRPLPYDVDPRCSRLQREGLVSRREKASSHCHEESEPLRSSNASGLDILRSEGKWNMADYGGGSKICSESSTISPTAKVLIGDVYMFTSSEDEDVCPTCLEEYTTENPKIVTQCAHHFHLGCIYEWMERSDSCPVCGKVMEFDETS
ncbi:hypothetical protein H6P81_019343 [Aristolochia fimbriata]|uniref:RING-type E3 ubiquitin transferase n=1 Tax=Aristolochia fimbriata TaxID=158543 RepID=A0AAV7DRF3_ARIFI|nr:hypothetical protein H6P81_019343 [Aristolochia fimbriata]